MARIPPGMTVQKLRDYFQRFKVERIYLKPEDEGRRILRKAEGGNFQRRYVEGWMEFVDKELAKFVMASFNGKNIGGKKSDRHYDDTWNIKYLRDFKWEDLVESGFSAQQERKKKLQQKIMQAKREHDDYLGHAEKAKNMKAMLERKARTILDNEGDDSKDPEKVKKVIASRLIKKKKQAS